jgi:hypothetical protein
LATKRIRIPGGIRTNTPRSESFPEFVESLKRDHPRSGNEIDAAVTDFVNQMKGGGISVEEVKLALLSLFPRGVRAASRRPVSNMKGRNTKR